MTVTAMLQPLSLLKSLWLTGTQYTDAVCTALCRTNWVGIAKFLIPLSPMRFLIA